MKNRTAALVFTTLALAPGWCLAAGDIKLGRLALVSTTPLPCPRYTTSCWPPMTPTSSLELVGQFFQEGEKANAQPARRAID